MTTEMKKSLSNDKENLELIKRINSNEEYNAVDSLKFKQLLGQIYNVKNNDEEKSFI